MAETKVVMWGAGDQGRVDKAILDAVGARLVALVDDTPGLASPWPEVPLFAGYDAFQPWLRANEAPAFVIAIGNPYGHVRRRLHDRLCADGLRPFHLADPSATISAGARVGEGCQVMPHAIIHVDARIGRQCIINTRALVEHDCVLEDGVEIGPTATLCGRVQVGRDTWICAGATILPRIRIGAGAIVGAGAVVNRDIPDGVVAVGVPARVIKPNIVKATKHDR